MTRGDTPRNHIVIGLGSGRCGTRSLAAILGVTHEAMPLPWEQHDTLFLGALRRVEMSHGDVGCYWLNYTERVLRHHPDAKFVCLKRDRASTVKSWARRMRGSERFGLWVMHFDGIGRVHAPLMFPDYGTMPIEEAAGCYWDDYYEKAGKLEERYPENFRIFWMDRVLNDRKQQKRMLRFAGIDRKVRLGKHKNIGGRKDPEFGNAVREAIGFLIRNETIYRGTRAVIQPKPGSNLGALAVKRGISKKDTDEIVMDFDRLLGGIPHKSPET